MKSYSRTTRIADLIAQEIATYLLVKSNNSCFTLVTVTHVTMSKDLRSAKVFVTVLDDDQTEEIIAELNKAAGYFQGILGQNIRLRVTPKIHFVYDEMLKKSQKLTALLDQTVKIVDEETTN